MTVTTPGAVFSGRVVAILATVAVLSFGLAFVISAFGEDLGTPRSIGTDTYSRSALGHGAFVELLRASGVEVEIRRAPPSRPDDRRVSRWLIEPHMPRDPDDNPLHEAFDDLWYARAPDAPSGALVVVAPKWLVLRPSRENPDWIGDRMERDTGRFLDGVNEFLDEMGVRKLDVERSAGALPDAPCRVGDREVGRAVLEAPRSIDASAFEPSDDLWIWEPWIVCGDLVLAARTEEADERPPIVFLADPDLLNNQGLDDGANAELALALVREVAGAEKIAIDETVHGYGVTDSLVAELFRFPLVLALLHGLLAAGVVVWAGAGRFGQPVPPPSAPIDGKELLIDNAARLLLLGRHGRESLKAYFAQSLRHVARHFALPADLGRAELRARLQQFTETRGLATDLAGLERAVDRLGTDRRLAPERVARLARKIHTWREEMTDGHSAHR